MKRGRQSSNIEVAQNGLSNTVGNYANLFINSYKELGRGLIGKKIDPKVAKSMDDAAARDKQSNKEKALLRTPKALRSPKEMKDTDLGISDRRPSVIDQYSASDSGELKKTKGVVNSRAIFRKIQVTPGKWITKNN